MTRFNLSRWALEHKSFVVYLMLVIAVAGLFAYGRLGREEDPPFTIKTMVVKTVWPGATALETVRQVTDRIEKKLEELPNLDYLKSYTKPGESVVFVYLKDSTRAAEVPDLWYQVRKKVADIKHSLPQGAQGPFFNDEFGDTYSLIFALTADGFSHRELRDYAERVRTELLTVPDVAKIDLLGTQDEKIYLEFSTQQLAAMGLDVSELIQTLQAQNAIQPSGTVDSDDEKIAVRVSGQFMSEESLKSLNFRINDRFFRLSDIAKVQRTYADPQQPIFRYNGSPAVGLAISMRKNGDVLGFGEHLKERLAIVTADLPAGIESHMVADQPHVVEEAVGEFIKTLIEAIAIVLAVSFLSLGWRPGIVVAIAIPLVLAITFAVMELMEVSLQRISLGALIIALGLLVDDAMIAVEMMIKKLEEGCDKITAATAAYTSTAFPMLTGTLVTIAGFVPVGFAASSAGEYTFTLFAIVGVALIASWLVAVLFTPLTGVFILPDKMKGHGHEPSRFARAFHALLDRVLHLRYWVIGASVALFVAALGGMQFVQQQFFPSSDRPELLVDLTLPQGSSINATQKVVDDLEKILKTDPDIEHWSFYIGSGAVRFYLPLDQQLANDFFAQGVIVTKGFKNRSAVEERILAALQRSEFEQVQPRISALELGPPVGWPLKFRISGPDATKVRELAMSFASVLGNSPNARSINFDWNEPSKMVRVEVDQDRARELGISSQALGQTINAILSGTTVTQVRDDIYLIDIVARAIPEERAKLETLRSLMISIPGGRAVPLEQIAKLSYGLEPPLIWRRHRLPTITVQAETAPGVEAATVVKAVAADVAAFKSQLPAGYDVVAGGTVEESAKSQASIFAVFPVMLLLMMTILMVQLQSFQKLFIVLATAPLALIGVASALLVSQAPLGFVAILGVISLIGMVIRNSVILIDQIDNEIAAGQHPWEAVIVATEHRLRPILLTAAAAILGMVPIAPTVFWGPMAYAVMGGLVVATLLTLVFLPALYVVWFGIKPHSAPQLTIPSGEPALLHG
ncbi:MAG TPA: efflux RND transporter permease subunit [Aestuariivirgaceae bacterium]